MVSTTPYVGRLGIFDPDAAVVDDDGADVLVAVVVVPSDLVAVVGFSSVLPPQAPNSTAADTAATGKAAYHQGRNAVLFILCLATVAGVVVCVFIIRGVSRQLGEDPGYLHEIASRIAAGRCALR